MSARACNFTTSRQRVSALAGCTTPQITVEYESMVGHVVSLVSDRHALRTKTLEQEKYKELVQRAPVPRMS